MTNPNQLCDVLLFVCSKMADGQITIRIGTLWAQLLLDFLRIILKLYILVLHGL